MINGGLSPRGTLPNNHRDSCIGRARYTKLETMAGNREGGDRKKGERMEREREGGRENERESTQLHANLDDLPEQSQNKVRPSFHDVLGSDIDDVASDRAGGVEGQCLVLLHREYI